MSEQVIYGVTITLLIGLGGLGIWIARQSLGLGGMPLFQVKQRRLGVVESALVDGRRRLLLVRRDNVEHLILTGGPIDLVLETGIKPPTANHELREMDGIADDPVLPEGERTMLADGDMPLILHREQHN